MLTQGFDPTILISKSGLHIHWLPMFLHLFNTVFEKLHKHTTLPNPCPKPPKLPPVIPAFCHFFTWFSNGTTGPKQTIKSTKSKFATPKVGELARTGKELGLGPSLLCCLPALQKTNNEPENKKPRSQKNTLLRVIPTMTFIHVLTGTSSGILSDISSDIHSIWHSIWHIFWHIFWHSIWQIFWHSIWHIFWHSI